jgi:NADH:ubiquinone oxidoreductase subunit D
MSNIKHSFEDHTSTIPAIQEIPATPSAPRRMTLNMGPQHPSTHGVLRIVLELEGETIISAAPDIGFLHTGIEKEFEQKNWQHASTILPIFRTTWFTRWQSKNFCKLKSRPARSGPGS